MGILLSEKGIGPTEERALQETREPETVSEVRSFLGLTNYSSRFIPHFAPLTEPLRKLTRKDVSFHFGPEKKASFESLKQSMAKAGTLAYFDKSASTKVVAEGRNPDFAGVQSYLKFHYNIGKFARDLSDQEKILNKWKPVEKLFCQ